MGIKEEIRKISKKVGDTVTTVSEKSEVFIENTKLELQKKEKEKELKELFTEMGSVTYGKYCGRLY